MQAHSNNILFVIPARGGSKGIPQKNIKPLLQKPLIQYSIDVALQLSNPQHICVSTDDEQIAACASNCGVAVPFMRPIDLATDTATTYDVLLHAVKHYHEKGINFTTLVLLQPTSPFRTAQQVAQAIEVFNNNKEADMVVSVCKSSINPYYNLFEESADGLLHLSKPGNITRRQDAPDAYYYNGAIYVIRVSSLLQMPLHKFGKIIKMEMDELTSIDIDTPLDWAWAEFVLEKNFLAAKHANI